MYKSYKFHIALLLIFILFGKIVSGQLFNYKHYNVGTGFPQSTANHIFQDNKGYLWFATQNGAVKFNGHKYEVFNKNKGLAENIINHINQDNAGFFWISTTTGLTKSKNNSYKTFRKKDGLYSDKINNTTVTPENKILICTKEGASVFYNDKFTKLDSTIIPTQFIIRHNKQILALTKNKIFILNNNTFKPTDIDISRLKPPFNYIVEGIDSALWIASENGIFKIYKGQITNYTENDGLHSNNINKLLTDYENNLWYSSESMGSGKYYNGKFHNFTSYMGMANTSVLSLFEDNEQNIWIGGRNGVTMINTKVPFVHYNQISPYKDEIVMGMTIDDENNIWFCTFGFGLFKYNGQEYINYNKSNGSIDNHFFDIEIDKTGMIWLASANNGIIQFNGKTFKKIKLPKDKEINRRVVTIFQDSKENLWFGTNGAGVIKFDGKKIEQFGIEQGFKAKNILAIEEDINNNIWFGTLEEDLYMYDGNKVVNIDHKEGINTGYVRCIEKINETLWFGTASDGIFRINKEGKQTKLEYINKNSGLNSNNIYLMYYDSKGNLWCGSEKGVDKLRFNNDNKILSIENYTVDEGFIGVETNLNASLEDQNGDIWFGTVNGAVRYNEDADKMNTVENKTYITDIKLFFEDFDLYNYSDINDSSDLPSNFVLPYDLNHLSFNFIGLCFSNPQKVKYKYRLIGQSKRWSPATFDNKAIFTNIAPGEYEFQVISANNDGIWNKKPVSVQFIIKPPYWQQTWFKTLMILAALIIIYLIVELRNKSLKTAKIKLENKVNERTAQLNEQKEKLQQSSIKITDGINYAEKIQSAMLPTSEIFEKRFSGFFILYKPRDIVSGDFYWAREIIYKNNPYIITVAADCTGHGIPGALISMLGMSLLNEIIRQKEITKPSQVLEKLRAEIKRALKQKGKIEDQTEGIDMVICVINLKTRELQYSGANNPLYIIRNKELIILKPTINPVGIFIKERPFENHKFQLEKEDLLYMFSDGFVDQFNGETGEKFKIKRFRESLISNSGKPMSDQKQILEDTYNNWKGESEQIDDILILGVKI